MIVRWAEKYLGLPFVDGGRTWSGVDCWGLVRLVFKHERGIELPTYGDIPASELIRIAYKVKEETAKEPWNAVSIPQAIDMAVMYSRHAPIHVGVMVDNKYLLHVEKGTNCVLIDKDHPSVFFRSIGFFRHTELMNVAA